MKPSCLITLFVLAAFATYCCNGAQLKEIKKFRNKILYAFVTSVDQDMNAKDSEAACAKKNLTLAAIDNQEENDAVGKYLRQRVRDKEESVRGWLGGSDTGRENRWYWIHDQRPFTFTNWAEGHPKKSSDQNCMYMTPNSREEPGRWFTTFCIDVYQGIPICQELL